MAPDGPGPNQWMQHTWLLAEVRNNQEFDCCDEQKTLFWRTVKWLKFRMAVHIVHVVKLCGKVENG